LDEIVQREARGFAPVPIETRLKEYSISMSHRAALHRHGRVPRERKHRTMKARLNAFVASRGGDMTLLQAPIAADVTVYSDGGGKKPASLKIIKGIAQLMRLQAGLSRFFARSMSKLVRYGFIDGLPGLSR
jgi:RNA polymerase sigma-70 factor (ECF subfamily)